LRRFEKGNKKAGFKNTIKGSARGKITLYNLRGEKIGELLPGGKVDLNSLLRKKGRIEGKAIKWQ